MDSLDRADFLANMKSGGRYERTVAIYRTNESSEHVGVFDRALLEGLPSSVRWIAHNGAGYDQIDVRACAEKGTSNQLPNCAQATQPWRDPFAHSPVGITVSNTPIAVDDATATTALYLMISALRHFSKGERSLRAGHWKNDISASQTHDLTGKTLAILGLGGIGFRLAELAHAFPMRIIYHSRRKVEDAPDWCEYFEQERMDEFLSLADVLSVHAPLRPDTEHLVDEGMIRKLNKGAVLVNTARGKVVDEAALIRALEDGHVSPFADQAIRYCSRPLAVGCCWTGRVSQ